MILRRAGVLLILAALLLPACERSTRDTDIKIISVSDAKLFYDRVQRGDTYVAVFLDPRPAEEFSKAHIPGARNLTLAQVKPTAKIDPRIDRYSNLVVYADNPASATARGLTKRLIAVGYNRVRFFAGGIEEWRDRTYPIEADSPTNPTTPPPPTTPQPPPASPTPASP